MEFKHSLSIMFSHSGYILKIFSWYLIALLITIGIATGVFFGVAKKIDVNPQQEIQMVTQKVDDLAKGKTSIREFRIQIRDHAKEEVQKISKNPKHFAVFIFSAMFIYIIYTFLTGLAFYPISEISDKLMSSNLKSGFYGTLISNFGRSAAYSICKVTISLPLDLLIFTVMGSIFVGLYKAVKLFAIPLTSVIWLAVATVRSLVFAGWLPRWIHHPEENPYIAFARGLKYSLKNYRHYFKAYLTASIFIYLISTGAGLASFGLAILILPGLYYYLFRLIDLVGYYKQKGMSFYTDPSNVVNTLDYGYRMQDVDKKSMQHISEQDLKELKESKIGQETNEKVDEE